MSGAPLPPLELMRRVGAAPPGHDQGEFFLEVGRRTRARLDELAPAGWSWEGKRVLDFGCGAGRTLRQFLPESERSEFWGCDIDGPSVDWLREHLCPPLDVVQVGEQPPLPHPDGHFDAIWGLSVFSHLDHNWAEWLAELHRVLAPDGWLMLTFIGDGMPEVWEGLAGDERWDPDRVGMAVFRRAADWDDGGPTVFLSDWWLRARWGRAFEVERLELAGFLPGAGELGPGAGGDQGFAVLRRREVELTPDDLRRPDPSEPREALAASADADRLRRELDRVYASRSWRVTRPLRSVARRGR